jgi:hypothetical protein
MRARGLTAAVAAACLVLGGCSGREPVVPQGNPDARHGAEAVDAYASIELMRALLIASSDGFAAGGSADEARVQLDRARAGYARLSAAVRAGDAELDHEVLLRFDQAAHAIRNGTTPETYRGLVGPLFDQLSDGITQAALSAAVRGDPGVQAVALRRVAMRMAATYDAAGAPGGDTPSRLAFQEAWGLWRRATILDSVLGGNLGSQEGPLASALNNLRDPVFKDGAGSTARLPARVDAAARRVVRGVDARFGLQGL